MLTYPSLRKKEIKSGEEGDASSEWREAHRSSVRHLSEGERGAGPTSGGSSLSPPPVTPEALALCAPASQSPPSFLSHSPQRASTGSSKLLEFTLSSFKEPEFLLGTRQLKFNLPFLLLGIKSQANKQSCLHINVERKATDALFEYTQQSAYR